MTIYLNLQKPCYFNISGSFVFPLNNLIMIYISFNLICIFIFLKKNFLRKKNHKNFINFINIQRKILHSYLNKHNNIKISSNSKFLKSSFLLLA